MSFIHYLTIKTQPNKRANGKAYAVALAVTKTKKFGKVTKQQTLSTKRPIMITGGHDSGKTYWLSRLYKKSDLIWSKYTSGAVYLDPLRPLMAWQEIPAMIHWYSKQVSSMQDFSESQPTEWARIRFDQRGKLLPWSSLKAYERQEMISEYLSDQKAMLFIDNAQKLTGRKQQIVKDCLIACDLYAIAVSDEERLPASVRHMILKRQPQTFRLGTETAYDATTILVYFVSVLAITAGAWEIGLVLGGLTAVSKSKRSSRQD